MNKIFKNEPVIIINTKIFNIIEYDKTNQINKNPSKSKKNQPKTTRIIKYQEIVSITI